MSWRERLRCPGCDRAGSALTAIELSAFDCAICGAQLTFTSPAGAGPIGDRRGLWRYAPLLACPDLDLDADIPVVDASALADALGAASVRLIDCTGLGTGTFKDLEAQVVLAAHADLALPQALSLHSTGNTARAYHHWAGHLGLRMSVSLPAANLPKLRGRTATTDRPIVAIEADALTAARVSSELAAERGTRHLAPPGWKVQGTAAIGYLLADRCPDVDLIVQTVGAGFGPLGYELGLRRAATIDGLRGAPVVTRRGYLLVQPSDTCAVARLWAATDTPVGFDPAYPAAPFEPTLLSTNVERTIGALRALPDARVTTVGPDRVVEASPTIDRLLADAGVELDATREHATHIALAGLLASAPSRALAGRRVAIVVTGSAPFAPDGGSAAGVELVRP